MVHRILFMMFGLGQFQCQDERLVVEGKGQIWELSVLGIGRL